MNSKLSVLIPTFNEQDYIKDCLTSVHGWADEIIISDSGSTDNTLKIAQKFKGVKIVKSPPGSFQTWRNHLLKKATGKWIFYLDADERATPKLKREISQLISSPSLRGERHRRATKQSRGIKTQHLTAFAIPRINHLLGQKMLYGGWHPDYVKRLFKKTALKKWTGDLHEEPDFTGSLDHLNNHIIHTQPDNLEDMMSKSIQWSAKEAQLLFDAHHPPATWWRILRMAFTTLVKRLIIKTAFLDGPRGIILALYQSWHTTLVYLRLWELQLNNPHHNPKHS
jgi:glycosyltransferase involved in cell wall biosynthesis